MASRSRARQFSVQMLYQIQLTEYDAEDVMQRFWSREKADQSTRDYADQLVDGVLDHGPDLDLEIAAYAKGWSIERMPIVDHIILRIALFELIHRADIPWKVIADEVVTLARLFSSEQSTSFINGIVHAWGTQNRQEVVK